MADTRKVIVSVALKPDARQMLIDLADHEGRSVSSMVERLVRKEAGQIQAVLRRPQEPEA